ncbi:hypothetical protein [Larkinella soli]|uniref:hypothetical protein n=1 Tax=Larkinella soli TaxID=1770527 RepID=UPI000FFC112E|nr:hypothetical protein [Larkinella soli]
METQKKSQRERLLELTAEMGITANEAYSILIPRLNESGMKPKRAREYSYSVLHNVYSGLTEDDNVLIMLEVVHNEMKGGKDPRLTQVAHHLQQARRAYAGE